MAKHLEAEIVILKLLSPWKNAVLELSLLCKKDGSPCFVRWSDLVFMVGKVFLMYFCFLYSLFTLYWNLGISVYFGPHFGYKQFHSNWKLSAGTAAGVWTIPAHLWESVSCIVILGLIFFTNKNGQFTSHSYCFTSLLTQKGIVLWFILRHTFSVSFTTVLSKDLLKMKAWMPCSWLACPHTHDVILPSKRLFAILWIENSSYHGRSHSTESLHHIAYFAAAKYKQPALFRGTGNMSMSPLGLTVTNFFQHINFSMTLHSSKTYCPSC